MGGASQGAASHLRPVTIEPVTRKLGRTGGIYVPTQVLGTIPVTTRLTSKNLILAAVLQYPVLTSPPPSTSKWFETTKK